MKKRKTAPASTEAVPADEDDDEEAPVEGEEDDDAEEEDEEADEEEQGHNAPEATGPTQKAKQVKGGVVPKDDNLDEVDEVTAADEEDDEE